MARQEETIWIAWAGWRLRAPCDWRPIRIDGEWGRGKTVLGNSTHAVMQVKWWRPRQSRFNAARWLRERLKGTAGAPLAPGPKGFTESAWVPAPKLEGEWVGRSLWYGYSPRAGLVIEAVVNSSLGQKTHRMVESLVLPSLATTERNAATLWSVFGASFESPAGYAIQGQKLQLGDLALAFETRDGRRLLARQVYPSDIALKRRSADRWLDLPVFKEYRKFRLDREIREWGFESEGKRLTGIKREGRKRLPFPLGFCRSRSTVAAIVHDTDLGRLLIAEYDAPGPRADEAVLKTALSRMNWALEEEKETK